jgi:phosphoglycolate phosphatase
MAYSHIIWDWNGTLFDDAWLCVDVMNGQLTRRGYPSVTLDSYAEVFDFPVRAYYEKLGFDFSREPFESLSDDFIGAYNARLGECSLREGAQAVLEGLAKSGVSQSILSAAKAVTLRGQVKDFRLEHFFTEVVGLDDHHADGKVETGLRWLARAKVDPARTLFIGDTIHDGEVAEALGVEVVYVYSGHNSPARLAANGARVLDHLGDLLDLIK